MDGDLVTRGEAEAPVGGVAAVDREAARLEDRSEGQKLLGDGVDEFAEGRALGRERPVEGGPADSLSSRAEEEEAHRPGHASKRGAAPMAVVAPSDTRPSRVAGR